MENQRYTVESVETAVATVEKVKKIIGIAEHILMQSPAPYLTYKNEQQRLEILRSKLDEAKKLYEIVEEPLRGTFRDVNSDLDILENRVREFEENITR